MLENFDIEKDLDHCSAYTLYPISVEIHTGSKSGEISINLTRVYYRRKFI